MPRLWTCPDPDCHVLNKSSAMTCEACGTSRPGRHGDRGDTAPAPKKQCATCGEAFEFWTALTPGEDGQRRCGSCHVEWLRRRAGGREEAAEHIARFHATVGEIAKPLTAEQEAERRGRALDQVPDARQCAVHRGKA